MPLQVILNDVWEVTEEGPSVLGFPNVMDITLVHTETGERRLLLFDTEVKAFRVVPDVVIHYQVPELRPREVKNLANWIDRGCPR